MEYGDKKMIESLMIKNFRGFTDFKIESLDRVNLVAGMNDVGKTCLLEAIFLLAGQLNVGLVHTLHALRGLGDMEGRVEAIIEAMWAPLFHGFHTDKTIQIEAQFSNATNCAVRVKFVPRESVRVAVGDQESNRSGGAGTEFSSEALQMEYDDGAGVPRVAEMVMDPNGGICVRPVPPRPSFPGYFMAARHSSTSKEDAKHLGDLLVEKESYDLLEALKVVEPRLTRVSPIPSPSGTIIYGDIGLERMLPMGLMGEGVGRFTSMMLGIARAHGGVMLIDEIENGMHYSVIEKVWTAIGEAARLFDVQVFATTHSFECIQAAHRAFEAGDTYDFRYHRLDRVDGEIEAVTFDREMLTTVMNTDFEIR